MGKITGLTTQQRDQNRVNVYLDGEYAFSLAVEVAIHLQVGQVLSPDEMAALQAQDTVEKARHAALRLLEYRPRSRVEIENNLRQKGFDDKVIAAVVTRLQEVALLDDELFARYWIDQRETFKPRSRIALQQELMQKGVSRTLIDTVLADLDETDAARRAAKARISRWANLPEEAFRLKMGNFLQRRGFNYEIVKEVTSEMWQIISDNTDATM
ncbi:MAG: RecX family transcriptional regulator [Chloroflexota bacterium]|nr:RecX family transcriptional regulator [Ardenticatenaceae bacterium]